MQGVLLALAPVFVVIALGLTAKRLRWVADAFWQPAERLTYYVLFPALLVTTTAAAEFAALPVMPVAAAMVASSVALPLLLVLGRRPLGFAGPAFSSVIQGSIRPNTYIALAAAVALAGQEGLPLVAICIVVNVPLVNLISVLALVRYGGGAGRGAAQAALQVAKNPLILACLAGGTLNAAGLGLPPVVDPVLRILGSASLPLALLAVGAGLDLPAARASAKAVGVAAVCKLVLLPLVAWLLCAALGLEGAARAVVVAFAALPVSASSYVLARQLGGDAAVMAGIITGTTVLAMVTMPAALMALR